MSRLAYGGIAALSGLALLIKVVGDFEGVRLAAYLDPVGVPTVCYGETAGVKLGDRYTLQQCKDMLAKSLEKYIAGIEHCVKVPLPEKRWVALVSFAYNLGVKGACKSSVVRLINAGQTRSGCNALLEYKYAMGLPLPGLLKRRQAERALCLDGLPRGSA